FGSDGMSFGGESRQYLNSPVVINGKRGCWEQESGLKFDVESTSSKRKGKVEVNLPQAEFSKIDQGRVENYALIIPRENDSPYIEVVSFTCAGENVLLSESFTGDYKAAQQIEQMELNMSHSMIIA